MKKVALIGAALAVTACQTAVSDTQPDLESFIEITGKIDAGLISFDMTNKSDEAAFVSASFCFEEHSQIIVLDEKSLAPRPEKRFGLSRPDRGPIYRLPPGQSVRCQVPMQSNQESALESEPVVILWQISHFVGDEKGNYATLRSYGTIRAVSPFTGINQADEPDTHQSTLEYYLERDEFQLNRAE